MKYEVDLTYSYRRFDTFNRYGKYGLRTPQDQVLSTKEINLPQRARGHGIKNKYGR